MTKKSSEDHGKKVADGTASDPLDGGFQEVEDELPDEPSAEEPNEQVEQGAEKQPPEPFYSPVDEHSEKMLEDTLKGVSSFRSTHDDQQLGRDPFQTDQQRHRDEMISILLDEYTESYKDKRKFRKERRNDLFSICATIIGGASVLFGLLILKVLISSQPMEIEGLVSFITACVGFLVLVIKLLEIITKYCFPENDEEYITRIVQSIQENDLQHKLANIDYKKKNDLENRPKK